MKNMLIIFLLIFCCSCNFYQSKKMYSYDQRIPYVVFPENCYITLPDSLGGDKVKGLAAISCQIRHNLKPGEVQIMKLLLYYQNGDTIVNYWFGQDSLSYKNRYPEKVKRYLPYFRELSQRIKIKRVKDVRADSRTKVGVMYRVGNHPPVAPDMKP